MSVLLVEPAVNENTAEMNKVDPSTVVSTLAKTREIIGKKVEEVVGTGIVPDYKYHKSSGGATVYDENGNNLVNDQVYGDIAMAGDKLFMVDNLDDGVVVFSIPEKKIIDVNKVVEESVPTTEVETKPVEVSTEPVVPIVENSTEVGTNIEDKPTDLTNIYGSNDLGEEVSIPVEDNVSFEEITEETPNAEIGSEATSEEDEYINDEEFDRSLKSLEEKNEKIDGYNSFLSQFESNTKEENEDVFTNTEFKPDSIEYTSDSEEFYEGKDDLEIVPDSAAKDVVKTFKDLVQENERKDSIIEEKNREIEALKNSLEKKNVENERLKQAKDLATSAIRDLRETVSKHVAEIERVKNAADIYKGKADGLKYELAEKDREIAKYKSQAEAFDYIRNNLEMYTTQKEYENSYDDVDSYMKY